jgi:hypothetical protein
MTLTDVIDRLEEMRDDIDDPYEYGVVTAAIDVLEGAYVQSPTWPYGAPEEGP